MIEREVIEIKTIHDIKTIINDVNRANDVHNIKVDIGGHTVEAPTSCNYKNMLMSGFEMIKKRSEAMDNIDPEDNVDGDYMIPLKAKLFNLDGKSWLDNLIENKMGGKRDGLRIKWEIESGIYFYDPFTNKLTQDG